MSVNPHETLHSPTNALTQENIRHRIMPRAAVFAVVGLLAIASTPPFGPASPESSLGSSNAEGNENTIDDTNNSAITPDGERNCTSIRTRPDYIYSGWACVENGDSFTKVGNG